MTNRNMWLRFLAVAIPLVLALIVLHQLDKRMARENWRHQMSVSVSEMKRVLTNDFHEVSADTLALAADKGFRHAVRTGNLEAQASRFMALARYKPHYQQIRYLDENGMERLRVDVVGGRIVRVPDRKLQDKAGRDYFLETHLLPDGALRLSHLDLNIEHGQIERPFRPMLRFSSPVFDDAGMRRGIIVINYGIGPLLAYFDQPGSQRSGHMMLLNPRGSWLAGGDPDKRWGEMLGNGKSFTSDRPGAWERLFREKDQPDDAWTFAGHLYARSTLRPVDFVRSGLDVKDVEVSSADPWWLMVSEAGLSEVYAVPDRRLAIGEAIVSVILLLWGFAMRNLSKLKHAAYEAQRSTRRLAQVVEQTTDLVVITDTEGRIDYVNSAFCEVTGYDRDEAIARTPALLKSGQHSQEFYKTLWAEIKAGRTFRDLFVNRRRDGTLFYEEQTISPLHDESGRTEGYVSTGKDITDSKVTRLAFYDQLTGLVNRTLFLDRLEHEMLHADRTSQRIAVLYMDLDGFKAINDALGHHAGDEVLREFSRRVGALLRRSDTFARLGGDEFAVLLKEIAIREDAEYFAEKVIEVTQNEWRIFGESCVVGVSIGISYHPEEDHGSDNLLEQADIAMYSAKRAGKNRYAVYEESQQG